MQKQYVIWFRFRLHSDNFGATRSDTACKIKFHYYY